MNPGATLTIPTPAVFLPLLEPARYKGAFGGRASGKSHFFAELLIEEQITRKTDAVCVREVQKSLNQSVKKLLEAKIAAMNAGDYFEVQDARIHAPHGGITIFQGMQNHTADSIKSLEGYDRALIEEGQTLSQRSLDMLRPTIRKPGSELWFIWNPDMATDPVDSLLRGPNPPPGAVVVNANYRDNPFLPAEMRAELEYDQRRDPDKYAHIWLGQYQRNSEARVFRNWSVEEFEAPADAHFMLGADWGFASDPSVLVRLYLDNRVIYIDHEAYQVGCEIDLLPNLFAKVPNSAEWLITADSARPETISYMQRHGYPRIRPAIKGPQSVEEGVAFMKSFDIVVHPRCVHTIDELTMYSYKVDPLTEQVMPILADKKNHVIDSCRYAIESARRRVVPAAAPAPPVVFSGSWLG